MWLSYSLRTKPLNFVKIFPLCRLDYCIQYMYIEWEKIRSIKIAAFSQAFLQLWSTKRSWLFLKAISIVFLTGVWTLGREITTCLVYNKLAHLEFKIFQFFIPKCMCWNISFVFTLRRSRINLLSLSLTGYQKFALK